MLKRLLIALFAVLILGSTAAHAKEDDGALLRVTVTDVKGASIPNAWVRVPDTEGRRHVDPATGIWETRYLYAYDGFEIFFQRGMVLELHISAPGYQSRVSRYKIRGGKNQLEIALERLEVSELDDDANIKWFKRSAATTPDQGTRSEVTPDPTEGVPHEEPAPTEDPPTAQEPPSEESE